jgi:hypothetical protein
LAALKKAVFETPGSDLELRKRARALELQIMDIQERLNGDMAKRRRQVPTSPSIMSRIQTALYRSMNSTAPISGVQEENYELAARQFSELLGQVRTLVETDLPALEADADVAGIPWTRGRKLPDWKPE